MSLHADLARVMAPDFGQHALALRHQLAREFGVTLTAITSIVHRKIWKHLSDASSATVSQEGRVVSPTESAPRALCPYSNHD